MGELPLDESGRLTAAGTLWAQQLGGIAERDVLEAISYFSGRRVWPPALAEIRMRALGIPELVEVQRDIGTRKLGFTRLVWSFMDLHAFTRSDNRESERILRNAYDFAVEQRLSGAEYPDPPLAIAHEPRPAFVPDPAVVEKARRELYGDQDGGNDHAHD